MSISWKLGRVAGIDLYLHPTFLLLIAYVGMTMGGLNAVLVTLAAFGCVLLHELGHALMAREFGIRTEDITLYPIGGLARLERMPRAPGAELLIALAGPAVNVAIAAGLWIFRVPLTSGGPWFVWFVSNLLTINLMLALFNLVPAFPMDGGRVLRALLSGWLGRARATQIAAGLGRAIALVCAVYWGYHGYYREAILAVFIYIVAGMELSRVLDEERERSERRWQADWPTPPPGFHWVYRGQGIWRLAPITAVVLPESVDPATREPRWG